ncbi:hypothetical protein CSUB01_10602 [Colletotrichum sublineola]|uniref:Uncharacterized protein n=1 Tax=Colletotrichum sublineola TaxID=1173701 RepID=A0A066XRH7_COLSU|nr:hypothetical protein CSUB01_10602 [Colletotrichum sublineola]
MQVFPLVDPNRSKPACRGKKVNSPPMPIPLKKCRKLETPSSASSSRPLGRHQNKPQGRRPEDQDRGRQHQRETRELPPPPPAQRPGVVPPAQRPGVVPPATLDDDGGGARARASCVDGVAQRPAPFLVDREDRVGVVAVPPAPEDAVQVGGNWMFEQGPGIGGRNRGGGWPGPAFEARVGHVVVDSLRADGVPKQGVLRRVEDTEIAESTSGRIVSAWQETFSHIASGACTIQWPTVYQWHGRGARPSSSYWRAVVTTDGRKW